MNKNLFPGDGENEVFYTQRNSLGEEKKMMINIRKLISDNNNLRPFTEPTAESVKAWEEANKLNVRRWGGQGCYSELIL